MLVLTWVVRVGIRQLLPYCSLKGALELGSPVAQVITMLQRRQAEPTLRHYSQALLFWVTSVLGCEAIVDSLFPRFF